MSQDFGLALQAVVSGSVEVVTKTSSQITSRLENVAGNSLANIAQLMQNSTVQVGTSVSVQDLIAIIISRLNDELTNMTRMINQKTTELVTEQRALDMRVTNEYKAKLKSLHEADSGIGFKMSIGYKIMRIVYDQHCQYAQTPAYLLMVRRSICENGDPKQTVQDYGIMLAADVQSKFEYYDTQLGNGRNLLAQVRSKQRESANLSARINAYLVEQIMINNGQKSAAELLGDQKIGELIHNFIHDLAQSIESYSTMPRTDESLGLGFNM